MTPLPLERYREILGDKAPKSDAEIAQATRRGLPACEGCGTDGHRGAEGVKRSPSQGSGA